MTERFYKFKRYRSKLKTIHWPPSSSSSCSFLPCGGLRPPPAAPPHFDGAFINHTRGGGALGDQRPRLWHHAAPPGGCTRRCTQRKHLHGQRTGALTRLKTRKGTKLYTKTRIAFVNYQTETEDVNNSCVFFSSCLQGSRAMKTCWRCSKQTFSCGCCGEAAELQSTNQIVTTNLTSSSLPCHENWSPRPKHKL